MIGHHVGYVVAKSISGGLYSLPITASWESVTWGHSLFVAVGFGTNTVTSPDGIIWTARTIPNLNWWSIAWNGTIFAAISHSSYAATSPDGISCPSHKHRHPK